MSEGSRTAVLCGTSPYLLDTFSATLLDAGWVPRLARTVEDLGPKLAAAPAEDTLVAIDLEAGGLDVPQVLDTVRRSPCRAAPVIAVVADDPDGTRAAEIKAAGIAWTFAPDTPAHEIRFALKSLLQRNVRDQRKQRRAPAAFPVAFRQGDDKPRHGHVADIHPGGLFIETEERYPLGEVIHVRFDLPEPATTVEARAEIVFTSPRMEHASMLRPGLGLKFRQISSAHEAAIEQYVRSVLQRMPDAYGKAMIGLRER